MTEHKPVDLDEEDMLCHTHIDYQQGILRLTQISDVAPRTIQKFKDAGWKVVTGILLESGEDLVPVDPAKKSQSSNQKAIK